MLLSRQRLFFLIGFLIPLAVSCSGFSQPPPTPTPIPRAAASTRPTYQVQQGEVISQLQFTGRITPVNQVELAFGSAGRVREVYVTEGEDVTAGMLLADLTIIEELEQRKIADELALRRAELELENARLELDITRSSAEGDHRNDQIKIRENNVALAEIKMEEVQLTIRDLEAAINAAQVFAPFEGRVLTVGTSAGRQVDASSTVFVIGDMSALEVAGMLQTDRMRSLEEGMTVRVQSSRRPEIRVDGMIRRLPYLGSEAGSDDPAVRITLDVNAEEAGLQLGDQVDITLVLQQKENVLWLPQQAIRAFENVSFVVVRDGDIEHREDVVLGLQGGGRVEIVEGLESGQVVVGP